MVKSTMSQVLIGHRQARERLRPTMLEFPRWKVWLVCFVVSLGVLFSIPSIIAGTPARGYWPKWLPHYRSASASTLPAAATC